MVQRGGGVVKALNSQGIVRLRFRILVWAVSQPFTFIYHHQYHHHHQQQQQQQLQHDQHHREHFLQLLDTDRQTGTGTDTKTDRQRQRDRPLRVFTTCCSSSSVPDFLFLGPARLFCLGPSTRNDRPSPSSPIETSPLTPSDLTSRHFFFSKTIDLPCFSRCAFISLCLKSVCYLFKLAANCVYLIYSYVRVLVCMCVCVCAQNNLIPPEKIVCCKHIIITVIIIII